VLYVRREGKLYRVLKLCAVHKEGKESGYSCKLCVVHKGGLETGWNFKLCSVHKD
jgi:hypothetical protein